MSLRPSKGQLLGLLPQSLVLTRGDTRGAVRYLSFDDGPDPLHTPRLLDLLAQHGAKASFFVVGHKVERHPELVQRIVDEGHMLGNHSYSHWSFKLMSLQKKLDEIERTDALLHAFDGQRQHRMRPPHGYFSADLLWHFVRQRRSFVYWSYDSLDYQTQSDDTLLERLRSRRPRGGDIVLMHDDNARAGIALARLLPEWLALGDRFEALPVRAR